MEIDSAKVAAITVAIKICTSWLTAEKPKIIPKALTSPS